MLPRKQCKIVSRLKAVWQEIKLLAEKPQKVNYGQKMDSSDAPKKGSVEKNAQGKKGRAYTSIQAKKSGKGKGADGKKSQSCLDVEKI